MICAGFMHISVVGGRVRWVGGWGCVFQQVAFAFHPVQSASMLIITLFLWGLVADICTQSLLHARIVSVCALLQLHLTALYKSRLGLVTWCCQVSVAQCSKVVWTT